VDAYYTLERVSPFLTDRSGEITELTRVRHSSHFRGRRSRVHDKNVQKKKKWGKRTSGQDVAGKGGAQARARENWKGEKDTGSRNPTVSIGPGEEDSEYAKGSKIELRS